MSIKKADVLDPKSYGNFLKHLKDDIQQTQLKAALSVTKELTLLYWRTGKMLLEKVNNEGWGAKTLERLARDLKEGFPSVSGFSVRNLQYMRKFAVSYAEENYAAAAARMKKRLKETYESYLKGKMDAAQVDQRLQSYLGILSHAKQHTLSHALKKNAYWVR